MRHITLSFETLDPGSKVGDRPPVPVAYTQNGVRSDPVVLLPPLLDHDPCFLQRVEDLPIQAFLPQLPIEALAVPVLPRTAGLDIQGISSQSRSYRATHSGPLPERIESGIPRHSIPSDSVSITSCEFSLRATRSASNGTAGFLPLSLLKSPPRSGVLVGATSASAAQCGGSSGRSCQNPQFDRGLNPRRALKGLDGRAAVQRIVIDGVGPQF